MSRQAAESPGARRRRRSHDRTAPLAFYGRISMLHERNQEAVDRQERLAREWAERNGREILDPLYLDENISALRRKVRPGFAALCDAIRSGSVRALIAYHPDRLTRNTRELEDLIDLLDEHAVEVVTVTAGEYDLTTPSGRMAARVVGAVATHESEHKAERVSDKHEDLARQGLRAGGPRPWGYADNACSAIYEPEAVLIREAAERVLNDESLRSIARSWEERGLTTSRGGRWDSKALGGKLRSSHLKGVRTYYGVETPGRYRAPDGSIREIEPILSAEQWDHVQAILDAPGRAERKPAVPYLLNGLVFDEEGTMMRGLIGARARYYATAETGRVQAREDDLDEIVTARFLAWLSRAKPTTAPSDAERDELEAEIERLTARREEARKLFRDGIVSAAELAEDLRPLNAELDAVRSKLSLLSATAPRLRDGLSDPQRARAAWLATDAHGRPILSVIERRDLLRLWEVRVEVAPSTARGTGSRLRNHRERVRMTIGGEILR